MLATDRRTIEGGEMNLTAQICRLRGRVNPVDAPARRRSAS